MLVQALRGAHGVAGAESRSLRLASCCSVEVVNGGARPPDAGLLLGGGDRPRPALSTRAASAAASVSPSSTTSRPAMQLPGRLVEVACRWRASSRRAAPAPPRTPARRARSCGHAGPSTSPERKARRSRSRTTSSRTATDCTRPGGEARTRSSSRAAARGCSPPAGRGCGASPARAPGGRRCRAVLASASRMASRVISWNTMRRTGTFGCEHLRAGARRCSPPRGLRRWRG